MKKVQILSLLFCLPIVLSFRPFDDLRARYEVNRTKDSFFKLPTTTKSPLIKNYVQVEVKCDLPVNFYCYPNDPRVCLMYDYNGYAAGIQISFLFKDVKHVKKYDYANSGGLLYSEIFNTPAWAFRAYFTNPEKLTSSGRKDVDEVVEGVWVVVNNTFKQISRKESDRYEFGDLPTQECVEGAGNIYVYNMTSEARCEQIFPIYILYDKGSLVGFGFGIFGKGSVYEKKWYEHTGAEAIKSFVPNSPQCFPKWINKYGFPTLTIFLVDKPWKISCS